MAAVRGEWCALCCLVLALTSLPTSAAPSEPRDDEDAVLSAEEPVPYNGLKGSPLSMAWLTQYLASLPDLQKRRPISINQDLMTIARLVGDGGRGRAAQAESFLNAIGKRSSSQDEGMLDSNSLLSRDASVAALQYPSFPRTRRTGRLSVGLPLESLSGMLQAQRRQMFVDRANTAHNRLMNIGKRSVYMAHRTDSQASQLS